MRALGFEPKKEEIQKMISDVDVTWRWRDDHLKKVKEGKWDGSYFRKI